MSPSVRVILALVSLVLIAVGLSFQLTFDPSLPVIPAVALIVGAWGIRSAKIG